MQTSQDTILKVKLLADDAKLPAYATDGSAAIDFFAHTIHDNTVDHRGPMGLPAGESLTIGLGVAVEVPANHVLLLFSRSGHGFHFGVRLANSVGVIDSDYRGEVQAKLTCDGRPRERLVVKRGDKVCQGIVLPTPRIQLQQASELSDTARGTGGFGSTGA